ncbi:hypothetical protein [Nocardia sp. NPDC056000]|uniref:hypothetical protein n=1 Tax=Nocardia sp. NPDC056000 TaxID=3345674 RepID=UPI0035D84DBC
MTISRTRGRRWRTTLVVAAGAALTAMQSGTGTAGPADPAPVPCSDQARASSLERDRDLLLARLGPLRTLRNPAEMMSLVAAGWAVPSHGMVTYSGMGMTMADPILSAEIVGTSIAGVTSGLPAPQTVFAGRPLVLFYRSLAQSGDLADPYVPHFPYELAGWAHLAKYTPGVLPASDMCLDARDWAVHERGVHVLPSFEMRMDPPTESARGQDPGALESLIPIPFGIPHPRMWDAHIWLDPAGGTPVTSLMDDVAPIDGAAATDSFYYPEGFGDAPLSGHPH